MSQPVNKPLLPDAMLPSAATYAIRQIRSDDAGEHARAPQGWELKFDQLSSGRFSGVLTEIMLDHVQLMRDQTNQCLSKSGQTGAGRVVLSLPLAARGDGCCSGHPLSFPNALLTNGVDLPELRTPGSLDLACLALDRDWLVETVAIVEHVDLDAMLDGARTIQLSGQAWGRLHARLQSLFDRLPFVAQYLHLPEVRHQLEHELVLNVVDALGAAALGEIVGPARRRKVVDRARQFALQEPELPPTIHDLCRHIGVSRRKLQDCFQEEFGLSPAQYLRIIRLNAVRRELRQKPAANRLVGDIAARWGFWHLGRFASDYKAMFGELPSETLRAG